MHITKEEVKNSWVEMVDNAMDKVFISRQAQINAGVLTAEEADEIIIELSNKHMERYAKMSRTEIHQMMLKNLLMGIIGQLEVEEND